MVSKRRAATKQKSQKRVGKRVKGKASAAKLRRPALQKGGRSAAGAKKTEPSGPKVHSSKNAHTAGKILRAIPRAKTIKEANDLKRKLKGLGASKKGGWGKKAEAAAKKRISQLRRNAARRKPKSGSRSVGRSVKRKGARNRGGRRR